MATSLRYPVFIEESAAGFFTGYILEKGHAPALATSVSDVLIQLKDYLSWIWENDPGRKEPDLLEPKLFEMPLLVRPEYKKGSATVFPCAEQVAIRIPCVYGHRTSGMMEGVLPTLGLRFSCHDKKAVRFLAAHYAQARLGGNTPRILCAHLTPVSVRLEELVVTAKRQVIGTGDAPWDTGKMTPTLSQVAEPINARSLRGRYRQAYEREQEVDDLLSRLTQRRSNTLLVGEPGVGKSTVLADVARKLEREAKHKGAKCPYPLWSTNASRIIAGMQYLGEWQERCQSVIEELSQLKAVLCFENLLDIIRTGGAGPGDGVAAFLAPYMSRAELFLLAESTPHELNVCRRLLPAFTDLFQILPIAELYSAEATKVLRKISEVASQNARIQVEDGVPDIVKDLFRRFCPYTTLPGQAVDFIINSLDSTGANGQSEFTKQDALENFARKTGLPELFLRDELPLHRADVLAHFRRTIIGQDLACSAAADLVMRFKAGMNDPDRPIGVFIFCGPTGVGKTALARQISQYFFGQGEESDRLIRLDMSEYGTSGGANRLVEGAGGTPSDFIARVRRQPFSLVLLDEVEKAHPSVFDILMNVFDEARLTDPYGRVTNFRSTIIIMTSNLGAAQQASLGFGEVATAYEQEVMQFFRPEFFNRLDGVVTFAPLPHEAVLRIAEKELAEIPRREGLKAYGLRLTWANDLVERIAAVGFDIRYGARPLQRAVETTVVTPIARLLAEKPGLRNIGLRLSITTEGEVVLDIEGNE